MSILSRKGKAMLLTGVTVTSISERDNSIVVLKLTGIGNKTVMVGMPPEIAAGFLEELSTATIGLVEKNDEAEDLMYR